ncbi:MAG: methyltransferase domain-containing protein [Chloroflexi bacterium]|nr:methyltransferase domain-containing protein [Chloroflexota bacterium]
MSDHREIYRKQANEYEFLVSREDHEKNLPRALDQIRSFDGLDVVELGAGTGRLTCMMAPLVKMIIVSDISRHMLDVAVAKLGKIGLQNWAATVTDNRALPVADQVADISIVGWSLGYFTTWYAESWRKEIGQALAEMKRVLRPGGTVVILETLGTGSEKPCPPNDALAAYYAWLENEHGFSSTWIRTDYQFESLAEAQESMRFFFGDEFSDRIGRENWVILPECTGIWWLTV